MIFKVTDKQYKGFVELLKHEQELSLDNFLDKDGVVDITRCNDKDFNILLRQYGLNDNIIIVPDNTDKKHDPGDVIERKIILNRAHSITHLISDCDNMLLTRDKYKDGNGRLQFYLIFDTYATIWEKDSPTFDFDVAPGMSHCSFNFNRKRDGKSMAIITPIFTNGFNMKFAPDAIGFMDARSLADTFNTFVDGKVVELIFNADDKLYKRIVNQLKSNGFVD